MGEFNKNFKWFNLVFYFIETKLNCLNLHSDSDCMKGRISTFIPHNASTLNMCRKFCSEYPMISTVKFIYGHFVFSESAENVLVPEYAKILRHGVK